MHLQRLACALLALLTIPAAAQTPSFLAADVHAAPRRSYPFYFAINLPDNRLVFRDATMLDLIATAWDLDADNVQGGPSWLELDRFDILAKLPPGTSKTAQKLMLRTLLAERFHLAITSQSKTMPAYLLTAKETTRLKPSEGAGDPNCDFKQTPGTPAYNTISCQHVSMEDFAHRLREMAADYVDKPAVNATNLEGSWDLELKWTAKRDLEKSGARAITFSDALDKQLGLKLAVETAPRPVVVVGSADRTPAPNAPGLDKLLAKPPLPQFEVATIKPSKPGEQGSGRIDGGTVDFNNVPLKELIDLAWDLNESDPEVIVNAPRWLPEEKFDILAKASPESAGHPFVGGVQMDIYEIEEMLRALLIERFQIKAHLEDRPVDAYTLLAAGPRLKPAADPSARTVCAVKGPPPNDPTPALNRRIFCRNITLAEFGDQLQRNAGGYLFAPVMDATGIKGRFDISLSFTGQGQFTRALQASSADPTAEAPAVLSLPEAVSKQLGLKLERQKRTLPVLVIEHIEEKPTEN